MNDTKNFCTRFSLDTFPWNPPTPWKMETSGRCDFESNWKCIQMVLVQVTGIRFLSNGRGKFPGRRCKFKRCIASGYGSLYRERRGEGRGGRVPFNFSKTLKVTGTKNVFQRVFPQRNDDGLATIEWPRRWTSPQNAPKSITRNITKKRSGMR